MMNTLLFALIGAPGLPELLIVGGIVLLLFGNRLPGAMRSLGRSIVEFKKGVKGIEDEVDSVNYAAEESSSSASRPVPAEESGEPEMTAPKFEPPPAEPRDTAAGDSEAGEDKTTT
jgi:sec-independent protein translocase protein TatA